MPLTQRVMEEMDSYLPDNASAEKLADYFSLFGDASRVRLLSALALHPLCVSDVASVLEMNQTTVSHQLRLLRRAGLVKYERHGKVLYYKIVNAKINDVLLAGVEAVFGE